MPEKIKYTLLDGTTDHDKKEFENKKATLSDDKIKETWLAEDANAIKKAFNNLLEALTNAGFRKLVSGKHIISNNEGIYDLTEKYIDPADFAAKAKTNEIVKSKLNADGTANSEDSVLLYKTASGVEEFRSWKELQSFVAAQVASISGGRYAESAVDALPDTSTDQAEITALWNVIMGDEPKLNDHFELVLEDFTKYVLYNYDGSKWVKGIEKDFPTKAGAGVDITGANDGDILSYDATTKKPKWIDYSTFTSITFLSTWSKIPATKYNAWYFIQDMDGALGTGQDDSAIVYVMDGTTRYTWPTNLIAQINKNKQNIDTNATQIISNWTKIRDLVADVQSANTQATKFIERDEFNNFEKLLSEILNAEQRHIYYEFESGTIYTDYAAEKKFKAPFTTPQSLLVGSVYTITNRDADGEYSIPVKFVANESDITNAPEFTFIRNGIEHTVGMIVSGSPDEYLVVIDYDDLRTFDATTKLVNVFRIEATAKIDMTPYAKDADVYKRSQLWKKEEADARYMKAAPPSTTPALQQQPAGPTPFVINVVNNNIIDSIAIGDDLDVTFSLEGLAGKDNAKTANPLNILNETNPDENTPEGEFVNFDGNILNMSDLIDGVTIGAKKFQLANSVFTFKRQPDGTLNAAANPTGKIFKLVNAKIKEQPIEFEMIKNPPNPYAEISATDTAALWICPKRGTQVSSGSSAWYYGSFAIVDKFGSGTAPVSNGGDRELRCDPNGIDLFYNDGHQTGPFTWDKFEVRVLKIKGNTGGSADAPEVLKGTMDEVHRILKNVAVAQSFDKFLNVEEIAKLVRDTKENLNGLLVSFSDDLVYKDATTIEYTDKKNQLVTLDANVSTIGNSIAYSTLISPYDRIKQEGSQFTLTFQQSGSTLKYTFAGKNKAIKFEGGAGDTIQWESVKEYENDQEVSYIRFSGSATMKISNDAFNPIWVTQSLPFNMKTDFLMSPTDGTAIAQFDFTTLPPIGSKIASIDYTTTTTYVINRYGTLFKDILNIINTDVKDAITSLAAKAENSYVEDVERQLVEALETMDGYNLRINSNTNQLEQMDKVLIDLTNDYNATKLKVSANEKSLEDQALEINGLQYNQNAQEKDIVEIRDEAAVMQQDMDALKANSVSVPHLDTSTLGGKTIDEKLKENLPTATANDEAWVGTNQNWQLYIFSGTNWEDQEKFSSHTTAAHDATKVDVVDFTPVKTKVKDISISPDASKILYNLKELGFADLSNVDRADMLSKLGLISGDITNVKEIPQLGQLDGSNWNFGIANAGKLLRVKSDGTPEWIDDSSSDIDALKVVTSSFGVVPLSTMDGSNGDKTLITQKHFDDNISYRATSALTNVNVGIANAGKWIRVKTNGHLEYVDAPSGGETVKIHSGNVGEKNTPVPIAKVIGFTVLLEANSKQLSVAAFKNSVGEWHAVYDYNGITLTSDSNGKVWFQYGAPGKFSITYTE